MSEKRKPSAREALRADLTKIMPGYAWTIHKPINDNIIEATGTQSSGYNRLSTLYVAQIERNGSVWYEVKSSGYGLRSPWLRSNADRTLAKALRGLQDIYESEAHKFKIHARSLENARAKRDAPHVASLDGSKV